jgi:hypothetical protein
LEDLNKYSIKYCEPEIETAIIISIIRFYLSVDLNYTDNVNKIVCYKLKLCAFEFIDRQLETIKESSLLKN